MELELGLKITKTRDDVSSSTDFRVFKDPFGPLSFSRETDALFVLIIHLKGFKKDNVEIEINKDGNRIKISGRKPVEEMVLIKWVAWKKEVEVRAFMKVFRLPEIVDLDKIKARFNDEEGTLTITMPKKEKGISGLKIEEEKEEEKVEPQETEKEEQVEEVTQPQEESIEEEKKEEITEEQEHEEPEKRDEQEKIQEFVEEEAIENEEQGQVVEDQKDEDEGNGKRRRRKRKRCCFPFLAGSSLLMSIIFFIIHLIESKSKRK